MTKNPILDELRQVRESLLAHAGGTLDALVDRLQTEERRSDHPAWPAGRDGRRATAMAPASPAEYGGSEQSLG